MPIPESPRVKYGKNPLDEVVCQVRFPAVLRIESELPSRFQEENRGRYPLFEEKQLTASPPQNIPPELVRLLSGVLPVRTTKVWEFSTEDQVWKLVLSKEFLGLSCREYRTWEEFLEFLQQPLASLITHYGPAFFARTGLRYRNVINRSNLGLTGKTWSTLLQPHISAELTALEVDVEEFLHQLTVRLGEGGKKLRMQHGLATTEGGETVYVIDNDFFSEERTETGNVLQVLKEFNRLSGKSFRWAIARDLHDAMEPQPLPRAGD